MAAPRILTPEEMEVVKTSLPGDRLLQVVPAASNRISTLAVQGAINSEHLPLLDRMQIKIPILIGEAEGRPLHGMFSYRPVRVNYSDALISPGSDHGPTIFGFDHRDLVLGEHDETHGMPLDELPEAEFVALRNIALRNKAAHLKACLEQLGADKVHIDLVA